MADKMAHTDDSVEVRDLSVRPTVKITQSTIIGSPYQSEADQCGPLIIVSSTVCI